MLRAVRGYERAKRAGWVGHWVSKAWVVHHRFWSAVAGCDVPLGSRGLGGGLVLRHPHGVVIHPDVKIGPNCLLFQQVTLGTGSRPGVPTLEGHVDVGAGAKILCGVRVGAHAKIGANAVVLDDVPPGATVVGPGARVIRPELATFPRGGDSGAARGILPRARLIATRHVAPSAG